MVNVPAGYQSLLQDMSAATGIPYAVEAAQAQAESNFNATAVSSTGAEGWLQFEPTTYNTYASQAGVASGTEFDPASEAKVYDVFMGQLLQQFHGNLRDSLAAYNAGPGNLTAGYGYADQIMAAAGQKTTTIPQTGTTGLSIPGLGGSLSVSGVVTDAMNAVLKTMGLGSMKDLMERAGLLILGFALVILGIKILSSGSSGGSSVAAPSSPDRSETSSKVNSPTREAKETTVKTGASEAVEAAAVA
jgi:hypothetical protein